MVISFRFNLLSFFFQPRDYIPNCIDSKLKFQVDTIRNKCLTFHYYYEYYEYYFRYLSNFLFHRRVFFCEKKKKIEEGRKRKKSQSLNPSSEDNRTNFEVRGSTIDPLPPIPITRRIPSSGARRKSAQRSLTPKLHLLFPLPSVYQPSSHSFQSPSSN